MNWVHRTILFTVLLFISLTSTNLGASSEDVIAEVGGKKITSADLQKKLEEIPAYARGNFETKDGKLKLLERIVRTELLKLAAIDAGYENRPDIQEKLEDARERILTSEYFKNEIGEAAAPEEKELKNYYDANKDEYREKATAKVKTILFGKESDAVQARKDILSSKITFEKAVQEYSKDIDSKSRDGKLGTITQGGFIKGIGSNEEIDDAIFSLKSGEISEPVKSRMGWHIFKVEDRSDERYKSFEEVKGQIADDLLVKEEDILKEYNDHPDKYLTRSRVKIKHIQLDGEKDAQSVYNKLKNGGDFDEMVSEYSTDKASIKQQGSLGYLYRDGYIRGIGKDPDFEAAVFKLNEGDFSKPIKSKKGWHIVLVEEKTEESQKPLSEVRIQIKNKLIRDMKESGVENKFNALEKKYNTSIYTDRIKDSK